MKRIHEISSKTSKRGAKINSGSIESANLEISRKNWPSSIFQEQYYYQVFSEKFQKIKKILNEIFKNHRMQGFI